MPIDTRTWSEAKAHAAVLAHDAFGYDRDALRREAEAVVATHRATMPCPLTGPAMAAWADACGMPDDPRLRDAVQQAGVLTLMAMTLGGRQ